MSAANYYQPHVWLGGRLLPESADITGTTALAELSITWGDSGWYENVEPAELTMQLIDPAGDLLGAAEGQSIRITRDPDGATVFVGTVDEVTSRYGRTTDPHTGKPRDMWIHQIRAYDPLGACARDRRRGPVYSRDFDPRRMHWGPCYMEERKDALAARLPAPVAWESTRLDQYDGATPIMIWPVAAYENQQVVSLLTVLRQTARISHALNRPYYFPDRNEIRFMRPAKAHWPGLSNKPGQFVIELQHSETLLPGSQLSMPEGITTETSARDLATAVELSMRTTRPTSFVSTDTDRYMENVENSFTASIVPRAGSQLTVKLETDFAYAFFGSGAELDTYTQVGSHMSPTYGAAQLTPLEYRFEKHVAAPSWAVPWLVPAPVMHPSFGLPTVYMLSESLTNWLPNTGPFSIPGGELSYTDKNGWKATLYPAAVASEELLTPPTLGDIAQTATLLNVSDASLIADWLRLTAAN